MAKISKETLMWVIIFLQFDHTGYMFTFWQKIHRPTRLHCPHRGWVCPHTCLSSFRVIGFHRRAVKVVNGWRNFAENRSSAVGEAPRVVQVYHPRFKNKHCFSGCLLGTKWSEDQNNYTTLQMVESVTEYTDFVRPSLLLKYSYRTVLQY